eukprot:6184528-Pleurochrysis_carterae.AAC.1
MHVRSPAPRNARASSRHPPTIPTAGRASAGRTKAGLIGLATAGLRRVSGPRQSRRPLHTHPTHQ